MRLTVRLLLVACVLSWVSILLASGAAAASPHWQAPLHPLAVTRTFEKPPTPYAAGHRGVDLSGRPAEPVLAAADGEVSFAGMLAGRGVVVVVHGDLRTTYEPVRATVRRGTRVIAGQQIATLDPGHAGCPAAACLHWGLLRGQVYLDPMALLHPPTIRLLPLQARLPAATPVELDGFGGTGGVGGSGGFGPSPAIWSLAALAGGGVLVAFRRR